jgi:hypothetical protein
MEIELKTTSTARFAIIKITTMSGKILIARINFFGIIWI